MERNLFVQNDIHECRYIHNKYSLVSLVKTEDFLDEDVIIDEFTLQSQTGFLHSGDSY